MLIRSHLVDGVINIDYTQNTEFSPHGPALLQHLALDGLLLVIKQLMTLSTVHNT